MSTETIFRHLGRLNESHTGIGPGKTREEYLKLFSRASYSSLNDWPYSSPFAGFYDVANSTTSLILLNRRFKFSHLRGQLLPKGKPRSSVDEQKTIYETLVETEKQQSKAHRSRKLLSPRVLVDPYRHFESSFSVDNATDNSSVDSQMTLKIRRPRTASSFNTRRTRSSIPPRSRSAAAIRERSIDESQRDPAFAESLWQYYRHVSEKIHPPKVGLQQRLVKEPPSRRLRQSGIYRNPALTQGQKLYLLEKCHVYDCEDAKTRHTNSYLQVLDKRFAADLVCKRIFRLNNPRDYFTYEKFVKTPRPTARPLNTGFFTAKRPHPPRIPGEHKKPPMIQRSQTYSDKKDLATLSNPSFSRESDSVRSSRRISASSIPTNDRPNVGLHVRYERKQPQKISVAPPRSDD